MDEPSQMRKKQKSKTNFSNSKQKKRRELRRQEEPRIDGLGTVPELRDTIGYN